jgi:hypothetical protein
VSGITTLVGECLIVLRRREAVGRTLQNETPYVGSSDGAEVYEYKGLSTGEVVELERDTPGQDGFDYPAVAVRRVAADD